MEIHQTYCKQEMQHTRQEYKSVSAFCIAPQAKEQQIHSQDASLKPQNLFNKIRISSLEERHDVRDKRREMQNIEPSKLNQEDKSYMSFEMRS